jgi:hypothetical protein
VSGLQTTVTTDVRGASYAGVRKHVEHDPNINHSNPDIDLSRTQYNKKEIMYDEDELFDLLENHYGEFVQSHDAKQKRKNRKYGSVENYLKQSKGAFDNTAVMTLGNADIAKQYVKDLKERGLSEDEIYSTLSEGLIDYARGFNSRNSCIVMAEATTNVDESTPHLHAQLIPLGHKSNGKPSKNFNDALLEQYGDQITDTIYDSRKKEFVKDNRSGLRLFRKQEDTALLKSMDKAVMNKLASKGVLKNGEQHYFEMYRKNIHGGLSHEDYKALEKTKDELKQYKDELEQYDKSLKHEKNKMKEQQIDLIAKFDPEHKVPVSEKIPEPKPVKTDEGRKQHKRYTFKWLLKTADSVVKNAVEQIAEWRKYWEQRDKQQKEHEKELAEREKALEKDKQAHQERKEKDIKVLQKIVSAKSNELTPVIEQIIDSTPVTERIDKHNFKAEKIVKDKMNMAIINEVRNERRNSLRSATQQKNAPSQQYEGPSY